MHTNPYDGLRGGRWIKTNFHAHAGTGSNTCGSTPVADTVRIYRSLGFGALCVSNHDLFTEPSEWNGLDFSNFMMIPGVEYSANPHLLTLGVRQPHPH